MHIALLTLKETIEGEMNGETVEIGINSAPQGLALKADQYHTGIVGAPANDLLGYEGVEGAVGPRFRKLSKEVRTSGGRILFAMISSSCGSKSFLFARNVCKSTVGNL